MLEATRTVKTSVDTALVAPPAGHTSRDAAPSMWESVSTPSSLQRGQLAVWIDAVLTDLDRSRCPGQ